MTHLIVDVAERAFMGGGSQNIHDQTGEHLAVDTRMRDALIAALAEMRDLSRIQGTLLLGTSRTALAVALLIQGYIDAVIREIEP